MSVRAAFFDVDETLIRAVSLFGLVHLDGAERGSAGEAAEHLARLRELRLAGAPRAETNRRYYTWWAGRPVEAVAALGQRWFDQSCRAGTFFIPQALAELHRHRLAGDLIVLVSGSFSAVLDPLARHLGDPLVLGTQLEIEAGTYTGQVRGSMIGTAKAAAVHRCAVRHDIDLERSSAYGDHESDLPVLELVGNPVVVGNPAGLLLERSTEGGWRSIRI